MSSVAKSVIQHSMMMSNRVMEAYLGDLDNEAIRMIPAEGINPIAWQLGHLLISERHFLELVKPGASPELPAGFDAAHGKDAAQSHDASGFLDLQTYFALMKAQREAALAVLDSLTDDDLAKPTGNTFVPTVGTVFGMIGGHVLMHAGQWVLVRRKLGKPVTI